MHKLLPAVAALAFAAAAVPVFAAPAHHAAPQGYVVEEKSLAQLEADMAAGRVTSEQLVRAYEARIALIDRSGPSLYSVIAVNPNALADARRLDAERRAGHVRGPLHGLPILIKDNVETADPMPTTAGSLALAANITHRDAPIVARLRAAGAVILGKTNLSEWANIRSSHSVSGWSAVGGLVKNPYALDRNSCGSSSGSGAAAAASLAAAAVGTETDGSVTCPSAVNGIVGIKPTVGLLSRTHIVPISHSQDTAGPMGRNVADVAALLTAMAGSDPADPATAGADAHKTDYLAALNGASLRGKRLGLLHYAAEVTPDADVTFARALTALRAAGAEVIEIKDYRPNREINPAELTVLLTELKVDLNAYLATTNPAQVKTRTLADLIAFDRVTPRELSIFDQDLFEQAEKTKGLDDPDYKKARATSLRIAGPEGIDKLLADNKLDALIAPTTGPAWRSDTVDGDHVLGEGATNLAAIAGYPHLTVPMGYARGLPVGLSFIGPAWSEARLLQLGYAFEQATHARHAPTYPPSIESAPDIAPVLQPIQPLR